MANRSQSGNVTAAVAVLVLLSGCVTIVKNQVVKERSAVEREAIGRELEERLFALKEVRPTIGLRQKLQTFERKEVLGFVETIPGAALIFGGSPAFLIDISHRVVRVHHMISGGSPTFEFTYNVSLRIASNNRVVSRASKSGRCIDSEALITVPARCSSLRPLVLRHALEGL